MNIGIIGFGRFGELITKYLAMDFDVYVSTRSQKEKEIKKVKGIPASFEDVCKKDIIIPCVPISAFENTIIKMKDLVKKESIVVDVCSVKEFPVKIMKKYLAENIQILATHPMFGPDSAADSLKGRKIVLCKVRIENSLYNKIKKYLIKKELEVIETTPEIHDMQAAKTMVLTHFVGRTLAEFGAKDYEIDTQGYKRLMDVLRIVNNDTWELFEDMNNYNNFSEKTRVEFIKAIKKINKRIK